MRCDAPGRVAVFRALQLGDMLCAVPALRAFRGAWPGSRITLIGLPWARAFAGRFGHLVDDFREFPGFPGLPERPPDLARLPAFLAEMRASRFDLAIQLHGSGRITNPLVGAFGADATAGFYERGRHCPDPGRFLPDFGRGTEVRRLLDLAESLGAPPRGEHLEFPVRDADREALRRVEGAGALEAGAFACVHPGASVPERRWPAERFAAVADDLAARGLRVVLTGARAESGLTRRVARLMRAPALDLAGRTDLGTLAALLEGARLLVCNDTGVSHLAAALRVPSVVLAPPANIARWAPADRGRHRVLPQDVGPRAAVAQAEWLLGGDRARAG